MTGYAENDLQKLFHFPVFFRVFSAISLSRLQQGIMKPIHHLTISSSIYCKHHHNEPKKINEANNFIILFRRYIKQNNFIKIFRISYRWRDNNQMLDINFYPFQNECKLVRGKRI